MTWAREALRGTLSTLAAPAVLLAAALIVAIGGSGADALSSLGQLTKGPDVPPTPVDMVSRDAPVGADVGQLDGRLVASAGARSAQVTQGSPPGPAQGSSGSSPSAAGGSGGGAAGPAPPVSPAQGSSPSDGSSGQGGAQPGTSPSASAPTPAPSSSSPPAPSRPNPVGDALDQTRQLGNELLKPVAPITDQLLGGLRR